jgi:hypothetical protein
MLLLLPLLALGPPPAAAQSSAQRSCIQLDRITAFAPRGEIYVEVRSHCGAEDFAHEDPVLAYLEVLVADLPAVGDDVRVYGDDPKARQTLVFRQLDLDTGDLVLVRLVRFGEILGLQSLMVP